MKKILITMLVGLISLSSFAGTSCRTDILGNYVCNGTGADSGYRSSTHTDILGNDIYNDNYGNRLSCHTDILGNYVCN